MKERPILFSAPMVRAVLKGSKTQTRRVWKLPRGCSWYAGHGGEAAGMVQDDDGPAWWHVSEQRCPYGRPGDRLWVRESFCDARQAAAGRVLYQASGDTACGWKPSIHMPRWASRITLQVTGVRVERLQDISSEDSLAEGIYPTSTGLYPGWPRTAYRNLWEEINGPGSWDTNPWVWVVEFRRLDVARLLDA